MSENAEHLTVTEDDKGTWYQLKRADGSLGMMFVAKGEDLPEDPAAFMSAADAVLVDDWERVKAGTADDSVNRVIINPAEAQEPEQTGNLTRQLRRLRQRNK